MNESADLIAKINTDNLPKHIAIIMDGNGRWAQKQGHERVFGHQKGVDAVREVVEASVELGVKFLTLYAFSTENWARPQDEVNALMHLLVVSLNNELKTFNDNGVRLRTIGNTDCLDQEVKKELDQTIEKTAKNNKMDLVLALSYSGRWEITEAVKKIAHKVKFDDLPIEEISEKIIVENLSAPDMPDPELLIRTSGEYRISNFLMWQTAYTELYFSSKLWPDFKKSDFYEAIIDYQQRERRFGKTREQITKFTE